MAEHALYGKKKLCYTEVTDFTDFQGIGQDPLYKRYDSVYSVIGKHVPEEYRDFLAQPVYSDIDDQISWYSREWNEEPEKFSDLSQTDKDYYLSIKEKTLKAYNDVIATLKGEDLMILKSALTHIDNDFMFCYDGKVTIVAWGMAPDTTQHIVHGTIIHGFDFNKRRTIRFDEGSHGTFPTKIDGKMTRADGTVLTERDLPTVRAKEGYIFKGWDPEPIGYKITGNTVFTAKYEKVEIPEPPVEPEKVTVRFRTDDRGRLSGEETIILEKGSYLTAALIPAISASNGYRFNGWDRSTNEPINSDTTFTALYDNDDVHCFFNAGEYGTLSGNSRLTLPFGSSIPTSSIPLVTPKKGYKFTGWNISPESAVLDRDTTFVAQYEKEERVPWWKRFWLFLTGKGCLKWLLWLLLAILLLFLLSALLRSCEPGGGIGAGGFIGGGDDDPAIVDGPRDDNGTVHNIIGDDGRLPGDGAVAPVVGDDGSLPPVVQNPGAPDVIANRLNIYFEDEDVDFNQFANDFKQLYPGDQYEIIGFDPEVGMIQIRIPESQRDAIRERLNSQLPNYNFFIVDESIFTLRGRESSSTDDVGWHLHAINLKEGWKITKGNSNVTVAVVDDGCDIRHSILKGRVVDAYNVFTQSSTISKGEGHGTHVAGLAVGSDKYFDRGVSGVAPKCKLMPVQVFDNEVCTFSSVTSGIMYAIHHGADVVNVSIGPNFSGLNILPVEQQQQIAQTQFKNEEKVWRKIIGVANKNNVILVLATGNDDIIASIPPECRTNGTLNVAAVNKEFKVTEFSNYGPGSNVSAPGQAIASSFPDDQFAVFDGTSMAAPIIAGTVALMKSQNKNISITEVLPILQQSGRGVSGNVPPMVQVDRALQMQRDGNVALTPQNPEVEESDPQMTDYDAIRRLIEEYKRKINDLEQMLPENNNR